MSEVRPRILVAEDDDISRKLVVAMLNRFGFDVIAAADGDQAWEALQADEPPNMAILDWMMPGVDGVELCRRIREAEARDDGDHYTYVLFLTARAQASDLLAGFEAGADDYLVKPFDPHELRSRVKVGLRTLQLQLALRQKVSELEEALGHVRQLQGLLPICMHCKQIRDDEDTWHQLEAYLEKNTGAMFTHTLCLSCLQHHYPEMWERRQARKCGCAEAPESKAETESETEKV